MCTRVNTVVGKVGLIGLGHLGRSLVRAMLKNGLAAENLLLAHRGGANAAAAVRGLGLEACAVPAERLVEMSDTVILAVRPQDALSLPIGRFRAGTLVVSAMAGLSAELLSSALGVQVQRMMCSGPDTIDGGFGVSSFCAEPAAEKAIEKLLRLCGLDILQVSSEAELDAFTVGICIPALTRATGCSRSVRAAITGMSRDYPVYASLGRWLRASAPQACTEPGRVATRGGVAEIMISRLNSGASLEAALRTGIERGREIAAEVSCDIDAAARRAG